MEGKVKWFSTEKGYGFITGTDGTDRYFSVQDVVGAELPGNGDYVTFEHRHGKKGPRAAAVTSPPRLRHRPINARMTVLPANTATESVVVQFM